MFFKCKHPFKYLHVEKHPPTVDQQDADFNHVNYHLYCMKCGERLTLKFATLVGDVDGFLNSGGQ